MCQFYRGIRGWCCFWKVINKDAWHDEIVHCLSSLTVALSHRLQEKMFTFPKRGLRYDTACVARVLVYIVVPRTVGDFARMRDECGTELGVLSGTLSRLSGRFLVPSPTSVHKQQAGPTPNTYFIQKGKEKSVALFEHSIVERWESHAENLLKLPTKRHAKYVLPAVIKAKKSIGL